MTPPEFILARVAEQRDCCDGTGEYSACSDLSDFAESSLAAFRAIVEIHATEHGEDGYCRSCLTDRAGWRDEWCPDMFPCETIRALASVWSDHPDYNPEWKVS